MPPVTPPTIPTVKGHSRWYDTYPMLLKLLDVLYILPFTQREALLRQYVTELTNVLDVDATRLQKAVQASLARQRGGYIRWYDKSPPFQLFLAMLKCATPMQLNPFVESCLAHAYCACATLIQPPDEHLEEFNHKEKEADIHESLHPTL